MSFSDGHSSLRGTRAWNGNPPAAVARVAEGRHSPARLTSATASVPAPDFGTGSFPCSADPEGWFPVGVTLAAQMQTENVKQICVSDCPVRRACLRYSFDIEASEGVWGGASEADRTRAKKRLTRRKIEATPAALARETERILADEAQKRVGQQRGPGDLEFLDEFGLLDDLFGAVS